MSEVIRNCSNHMARFKIPKKVQFGGSRLTDCHMQIAKIHIYEKKILNRGPRKTNGVKKKITKETLILSLEP